VVSAEAVALRTGVALGRDLVALGFKLRVVAPFVEGKMVRIAGLAPANRVVSSLLIIAFRYTSLLWSIQHCTGVCKHYFAIMCEHGQKYVW
jgi:hypothetical protein